MRVNAQFSPHQLRCKCFLTLLQLINIAWIISEVAGRHQFSTLVAWYFWVRITRRTSSRSPLMPEYLPKVIVVVIVHECTTVPPINVKDISQAVGGQQV